MLNPQKDRSNTTIPHALHSYDFKRVALPLFKVVGSVPKTTQAGARPDIACASCEMRAYHLGLESLDLLPPFKDMYICEVCNRTYHWQCLLKSDFQ
jgi:hypothetical protein